jgi:fucose 4-O-acetylase-like acetyltransferase
MKLDLKSNILKWLGENLFWLYILQRIPFMVLQDRIANNYLYIFLCAIFSILLTIIVKKTLDFVFKSRNKIPKNATRTEIPTKY